MLTVLTVRQQPALGRLARAQVPFGAEVTKHKEAGTIDYYQFCFNQDGSTLILLDKFKALHPVSNKRTEPAYPEVIFPVITHQIAIGGIGNTRY